MPITDHTLPPPAAARAARGDLRTLLRFGAAALLVPLYYRLDLAPLCRALRLGVSRVLAALGHEVRPLDRAAGFYLEVGDSGVYEIGANCTYLDLALVLGCFVWRFGRPPAANLGRLGALAAAVLAVNLARVTLALHLHQAGVSWSRAHALPDLALHAAAIAAAVLLAMRRDFARNAG